MQWLLQDSVKLPTTTVIHVHTHTHTLKDKVTYIIILHVAQLAHITGLLRSFWYVLICSGI